MKESVPNKHRWEFQKIGGATRVMITKGSDIEHLAELDQKMWTVLSCPVKGLEIDEKSLKYIDVDQDGKIHINDIIKTSEWVLSAIKESHLLLKSSDSISVDDFNTETELGKKLYRAARHILSNLTEEKNSISIEQIKDVNAIFSQTKFNGDGVITPLSTDDQKEKEVISTALGLLGSVSDRSGEAGINVEIIESFYKALADYLAWIDSKVELPYGEKTDTALNLYTRLDAKVKDFFMRSKLAAYSPESAGTLDVQIASISSISAENLTGKVSEIAEYPISRVTGKAEIDLKSPVNPAWADDFHALMSIVFEKKKSSLTETMWNEIGAKLAPYSSWLNSKAGAAVESLGVEKIKELLQDNKKEALLALVAEDLELSEEANNIELLDKFLHIFRDFYTLLKNFVTFQDFYAVEKSKQAIFQAGKLVIDQRSCDFCMDVADMAKHSASASSSGLFLVYCDCTTKSKPGKRQIVAAVTVGEIGELTVGKNAIFYDNTGLDWDAVVTKVVENPISIGQAFWSPYRRMGKTVSNLINKSAAEKDAKIMADANAKIAAAPAAIPAGDTTKAAAAPAPFDIGKFAGIFAAIGMAVGMIGTALASIFSGFATASFLEIVLAFVGIILVISGPSMLLAWMKLRKRNIAPLLNANGWAINSAANVNIVFGNTLTQQAKFPIVKLKDPYADKGIPAWAKALITILIVAIVAAGLWLGNLLSCVNLQSPLPCFDKVEEVVEAPVSEENVAVPVEDQTK